MLERSAARLTALVVLPTPPLPLAIARILDILRDSVSSVLCNSVSSKLRKFQSYTDYDSRPKTFRSESFPIGFCIATEKFWSLRPKARYRSDAREAARKCQGAIGSGIEGSRCQGQSTSRMGLSRKPCQRSFPNVLSSPFLRAKAETSLSTPFSEPRSLKFIVKNMAVTFSLSSFERFAWGDWRAIAPVRRGRLPISRFLAFDRSEMGQRTFD